MHEHIYLETKIYDSIWAGRNINHRSERKKAEDEERYRGYSRLVSGIWKGSPSEIFDYNGACFKMISPIL